MHEAITLRRGGFGSLSSLSVANGFVTHAHREAHVVVWIDGISGDFTVGNQMARPGPDVAIGINSLEPHSHYLSPEMGGGHLIALYLNPEWLRRRRAIEPGAALFQHPVIPVDAGMRDNAASLFWSLSRQGGAADACDHDVECFIDRLIDAADAERVRRSVPPRVAQPYDFRIRKAVSVMQANVGARMSLDELAQRVGLSRPHFFWLFKQQMNVTPNIYWNTLRMEAACRQLQDAEDDLTSVAFGLGFTTEGNFSRFFRDHIGVPPTLYRSAVRVLPPL